jgi:DNA-binding NarL/FixJ family response regulator
MTATLLQHPRLWTRRVVIARRGRLVRAALRHLLESQPTVEVVGEAGDGEGAVAVARRLCPDCIVLDAGVPGLDWLEATRQIAATTSVAVIVVSPSRSEGLVAAARDAGAMCVVLEDGDPAELVEAVRLGAPMLKEAPMLPPNVIEIRRGSAHVESTGRAKPGRARRADVRLVKKLPVPLAALR